MLESLTLGEWHSSKGINNKKKISKLVALHEPEVLALRLKPKLQVFICRLSSIMIFYLSVFFYIYVHSLDYSCGIALECRFLAFESVIRMYYVEYEETKKYNTLQIIWNSEDILIPLGRKEGCRTYKF